MGGMQDVWQRLAGIGAVEPPESGLPRAAVLVPLYEEPDGEVRVVLTKRPLDMPTHGGHLAFPGGRPDPDDRGPTDTALREAAEEVGIDADSVEVLGFLPPIHTVEYTLMVIPVVGRLAAVPDLRPSPREVDKILQPPVAIFFDAAAWRYEVWAGRKVWFFDLDGEVLWGATAHMMRQLVGLEPPVPRLPPS